jgi:hypothetical protein
MRRGHVALLIWLLSISPLLHSAVTATVDQNQISEFDVLTLTIRVTDQGSTEPDFQALERDFTIINQQSQQNSSISLINGRQTSRSYIDYQVTLRPKRQGNLLVPALTVGTERTNPIGIRVVAQSQAVRNQMAQILFFETLVDREEVYVQAQLLYTVRLYYADSISGDFPAAPDLPNTMVEIIENERRFETVVNNRRYYVLEKRYAIFPQQSGPLNLAPETFVGTRGRGGLFSSRERVNAVSSGHSLSVLPVPASFQGRRWLPAQSLAIDAVLNRPDSPLVVGDPINRVVTLKGAGVTAALLPELRFEDTAGARLYIDQPVVEELASEQGLAAESVVTVGIVPTEAGTLALPDITVYWWNTEDRRQEVAVLPGINLAIGNAPKTAPTLGTPSATQPPRIDNAEILLLRQQLQWTIWIAIILLVAWLLTLVAWFKKPVKAKTAPRPAPPQFELGPLTRAIKLGDPQKTYSELQRWRRHTFPNTTAMASLTKDYPELETPYRALEATIYQTGEGGDWRSSDLLAVVTKLSALPHANATASPLPERLNPGL